MHHTDQTKNKNDVVVVGELKIDLPLGQAIHVFRLENPAKDMAVFNYLDRMQYEITEGIQTSFSISRPFDLQKESESTKAKFQRINNFNEAQQKKILNDMALIELDEKIWSPTKDSDYKKLINDLKTIPAKDWRYDEKTLLAMKNSMANFSGVKKINEEVDQFKNWAKTHPGHHLTDAVIENLRACLITGYLFNVSNKHLQLANSNERTTERKQQNILLQRLSLYFNNTDSNLMRGIRSVIGVDEPLTKDQGKKQAWFDFDLPKNKMFAPIDPIKNAQDAYNVIESLCATIISHNDYKLLGLNDQESVLDNYLTNLKKMNATNPNQETKILIDGAIDAKREFHQERILNETHALSKEIKFSETWWSGHDQFILKFVDVAYANVLGNFDEAYKLVGEFHNKILNDKNFQEYPKEARELEITKFFNYLTEVNKQNPNAARQHLIARAIESHKTAFNNPAEGRINSLIDHYNKKKDGKLVERLRKTLENIHADPNYLNKIDKKNAGFLKDIKKIEKDHSSFLSFFKANTLSREIKEIKNSYNPEPEKKSIKDFFRRR